MKRIITTLALMIASIGTSFASQYPADYGILKVGVAAKGPARVITAGSGMCSSKYYIAYSNDGMLAGGDFVDAVVTLNCRRSSAYGSYPADVTRVIRLEREWHGQGYMSVPQSNFGVSYEECSSIMSLSVAFAVHNRWDSNYGQNFSFNGYDLFSSPRFSTGNHNCDPNQQEWDYILDRM